MHTTHSVTSSDLTGTVDGGRTQADGTEMNYFQRTFEDVVCILMGYFTSVTFHTDQLSY